MRREEVLKEEGNNTEQKEEMREREREREREKAIEPVAPDGGAA